MASELKLQAESSVQPSVSQLVPSPSHTPQSSTRASPPHSPAQSSTASPPQSPLQSVSTMQSPLQSKFSSGYSQDPSFSVASES